MVVKSPKIQFAAFEWTDSEPFYFNCHSKLVFMIAFLPCIFLSLIFRADYFFENFFFTYTVSVRSDYFFFAPLLDVFSCVHSVH